LHRLRLLHGLRRCCLPSSLFFLDEDIADSLFISASYLSAFVGQRDFVVIKVENLLPELVRFSALDEDEEKPVSAC
jgi:hypothetical protein